MMTHTAGPWHHSSTHLGKAFDIGAADGDNIALVYGPAENGSDNFRANARVIALAPEMAEALDALHDAADSLLSGCEVSRGRTPEDANYFTHELWAEKELRAQVDKVSAIIARLRGERVV